MNTSFFVFVALIGQSPQGQGPSHLMVRAVRSEGSKSRQRQDKTDGIIKAEGFDEHGQ
ncbi:hypothetical protein ACQZ4Q_20515 [Agrobacterium vitis]|uniref:hypothetical protein n=1 Tax=Agrobacterium vitis TaxID=373 RepID=UPI003D2C11F6